MPDLVAVGDDGSMKFVGHIRSIEGPTPSEEDPEVEVYKVTAEAFDDEYDTTWYPV